MEDQPLDVLAKKAYRIMEQRTDAPGSVAAIAAPANNSLSLLSIGEVDAVRRLLRRDGRPPRGDDNRGRGSRDAPFTCRNHAKWGPKAFSCSPGCLFEELPLAKRPAGNSNAGR